MSKATLCDGCACGVSNNDWTHLDHDMAAEDADETMARIASMMELTGWLTPIGDANRPGYFQCDLCWETQCGGGHTFTTEKAVAL